MAELKKYHDLKSALWDAEYGVLYLYVAPSLQEGWFAGATMPPLEWYERLALVDRQSSQLFLREVGADEPYAFLAVGHGFVLAQARNAVELRDAVAAVRRFVTPINSHLIKIGMINSAKGTLS